MVDALDRHLPAGFIQASSFSTCMAASITLIGWLVNFFRRFPKKFSNVNQTPFFPETILLLPPIHKRNASPSLQFPGSYYHCKRMERNRHPVILSQDACLPSSRHLYFPFPVAQDPPLVVLPRQIKNAIADVQNCRHDKHEHQLCLGLVTPPIKIAISIKPTTGDTPRAFIIGINLRNSSRILGFHDSQF